MTAKVDKIKKLENGKLAVKWQGSRKYRVINDEEIASYLVYLVLNGKETVNESNRQQYK